MSERDFSDAGVKTFLHEAEELLQQVEMAAMALEDRPGDADLINQLFRAFHTLKGSGAMVGFHAMSAFTHRVESELDHVRSGHAHSNPQLVGTLLMVKDHIQTLLTTTTSAVTGPDLSGEQLISELSRLCGGVAAKHAAASTVSIDPVARPAAMSSSDANLIPLDDLFICVEPSGIRYERMTSEDGPAKLLTPAPITHDLQPSQWSLTNPSERLDRLVTLVEQLVIQQARLNQAGSPSVPPELADLVEMMGRLSETLQKTVLGVAAYSARVPSLEHYSMLGDLEMLPTLSIVDGLLVEVAGLHFIIPLAVVLESVVLRRAECGVNAEGSVAELQGGPVQQVVLRELLHLPAYGGQLETMVVVVIRGARVGVVVDRVVGRLACGAGLGAARVAPSAYTSRSD